MISCGVSALASSNEQVGIAFKQLVKRTDPDVFEQHRPETDEEHEVARVATEYLRWLIDRREVFREREIEVVHVNVREEGRATVWFTGLVPGPVLTISLRRVDDGWRGVEYGSYATA